MPPQVYARFLKLFSSSTSNQKLSNLCLGTPPSMLHWRQERHFPGATLMHSRIFRVGPFQPSRERRRQARVGLHQELAKRIVVVRAILHVFYDVLCVFRVLSAVWVEAAVRSSAPPPRRIEQKRAVGRARRRVLETLQPFGRARVGAPGSPL